MIVHVIYFSQLIRCVGFSIAVTISHPIEAICCYKKIAVAIEPCERPFKCEVNRQLRSTNEKWFHFLTDWLQFVFNQHLGQSTFWENKTEFSSQYISEYYRSYRRFTLQMARFFHPLITIMSFSSLSACAFKLDHLLRLVCNIALAFCNTLIIMCKH